MGGLGCMLMHACLHVACQLRIEGTGVSKAFLSVYSSC